MADTAMGLLYGYKRAKTSRIKMSRTIQLYSPLFTLNGARQFFWKMMRATAQATRARIPRLYLITMLIIIFITNIHKIMQ